jgi:integrase
MSKLTDMKLRAWLKRRPPASVSAPDGTVPGLSLRAGRFTMTWSLKLRVTGEGGVSQRGHQKKGKTYRITLGEYPDITLDAARGIASTYWDQAKKGVSPVAALEGAATARGLTIKALSEVFITDYVAMRQLRAPNKYRFAIDVHIVPHLGDVLADRLTREQVRAAVKKTMVKKPRGEGGRDRRRGGQEAARTVVSVLRKMLSWASDEDKIKRKDNPASGMEKNLPKKRKGERVLTLDEAREAWRAAASLGYPFGPAYQLIMLTGCRPGEWARCLRPYVHLDQALLVLPADAYKSDHVHIVPLVPDAVEILRDVLMMHPGESGAYIFSGTDGKKPLTSWFKAQIRMRHAMCAHTGSLDMRPWTPHDLRRTVATRIAEALGVGGEQLIKRVLGHADGSVTAIYNRYGYVKEMRSVLTQWADDLLDGKSDQSRSDLIRPVVVNLAGRREPVLDAPGGDLTGQLVTY